jgi:hypothetical protein
MTRRLFSFGCVALCCMLLFSPQAAWAEKQNWEKHFHSQVKQWMETIVQRDGQFREWRNAGLEVKALGANQRQWLVSIHKSGKQVGYLVVGEAPEGTTSDSASPRFVLLEYGVGEYILFDDAFAPREVAAEPVYDGFASYWRVAHHQSQQLIDAKTGEAFPLTAKPDAPVMQTVEPDVLAGSGQTLTQTLLFNAAETDPFDDIGWLTHPSKPASEFSWKQLMQRSASKHVTLTVSLYQNEVFAPFSVNSLHLWNDKAAYVGVWDGGLRFLPYAYADSVGDFHVN